MVDLVVQRGWAATTMAAIAKRAGVSEQLLYKRFGTKVALASRAYDVTLVGDQEPVALAGRDPVARIIAEPNPAQKVALYVDMARGIVERVGPFRDRLVAGALSGDRELAALVDRLEEQRVAGVRGFVGHLREVEALSPTLNAEQAVDIVWTLVSPAIFGSLTGRGWSYDDVQRWLSGLVPRAILASSKPTGRSG